MENRFPSIWMPSTELRDLRTLLMHRHQWVRMRTRVQNTLQAIAIGRGLRRGKALWSQAGQHAIASLPLPQHTAYRRTELQDLYHKLHAQIDELDKRVGDQALQRPGAKLLMSHPGVGPVTALATDVFLGDPARFADGKAVVSYVGMIPSEYSSGGQQRLGGLSKQGNPFLRFLWCEAAVHAVRRDPELQRFYRRKLAQKGLGKARVAAARKLGIRLWIMLREQIDYQEFCRRGQLRQKNGGACAGMPEVGHSPAMQ
jgi:transposase